MNDKGLAIALTILFGCAGLVLLVAGWIMPHLASDRVLTTLGGLTGLGFAAFRGRTLLQARQDRDAASATVEVRTAERR